MSKIQLHDRGHERIFNASSKTFDHSSNAFAHDHSPFNVCEPREKYTPAAGSENYRDVIELSKMWFGDGTEFTSIVLG